MTSPHPIITDMLQSRGQPQDLTQQQTARLREDLLGDLFLFAWLVFDYHDLNHKLHGEICELMRRWGDSDHRRLLVQIPRGHLKTSLCTIANSLWQVCKDPDAPVAIFNERQDNTAKWIRAIKNVIGSSLIFQEVFKDLLPPGIHRKDSRNTPRWWRWSDTEIDLQRGAIGIPEASITGLGIGSASAGGHWDKIIKDDLISEDAKNSPSVMDRAKDWLDNSFALERPALHGQDLIVCTPWLYNDLYAYAIGKYDYQLYRRQAIEYDQDDTPYSIFPEKFSLEELEKLNSRDPYHFSCTPSETPITMANGRTKPICLVEIGDEVVGMAFDKKRYLVRAKVLDRGTTESDVFEYYLDDGETVRCTEDHQWLRSKRGYGPIDFNRGGHPSRLARIHSIQPCSDPLAAAWLGGFYDGEGSHSGQWLHGPHERSGGFISFSQSYKRNPHVCQKLEETLSHLGFKFGRYDRTESQTYLYHVLGGYETRFRFLQWCDPTKDVPLISSLYGGRAIRQWPKVLYRKNLGRQKVHWLHTTTGNYIAWGCLSKNSQFMCQPRPGREMAFDESWVRYGWVTATDFHIDPDYFDPKLNPADVPEPPTRTIPLSSMEKVLLFDPAPSEDSKKRKNADARNALVMEGLDYWGRRYLLDVWADRVSPPEVLSKIFTMLEAWGCETLAVEEIVFSILYKHWIQDHARRLDKWIRIVPLKPALRTKDARIQAKIGPFEAGHYYVNTTAKKKFLREYLEYPYSKTRDILDAIAYDDEPGVIQRPLSPEEIEQERIRLNWQRHYRGIDQVTGY